MYIVFSVSAIKLYLHNILLYKNDSHSHSYHPFAGVPVMYKLELIVFDVHGDWWVYCFLM